MEPAFPLAEIFITDNWGGYVGALASAGYYRTNPPASAVATVYFVAGPYGGFQHACRRHNPARVNGKIRYRWFCTYDKRLDIVQF